MSGSHPPLPCFTASPSEVRSSPSAAHSASCPPWGLNQRTPHSVSFFQTLSSPLSHWTSFSCVLQPYNSVNPVWRPCVIMAKLTVFCLKNMIVITVWVWGLFISCIGLWALLHLCNFLSLSLYANIFFSLCQGGIPSIIVIINGSLYWKHQTNILHDTKHQCKVWNKRFMVDFCSWNTHSINSQKVG